MDVYIVYIYNRSYILYTYIDVVEHIHSYKLLYINMIFQHLSSMYRADDATESFGPCLLRITFSGSVNSPLPKNDRRLRFPVIDGVVTTVNVVVNSG